MKLKGITWNHTRGYIPMVATSQRFKELHPEVEIEWNVRSLQHFADKQVDELSKEYDFLVIDHPWIGCIAKNEVSLRLEKYLSNIFMQDQKSNSVGKSFDSYYYNGSQWAVPIDAATPVASSRLDNLKKVRAKLPKNMDDVFSLAKKGCVIFPGIPQDTLMNFFMFCSAFGEDPFTTKKEVISKKVGLKALKILYKLAQRVDPICFDWNPIQVYEAMAQEDHFAYCPFAYGYVNYARDGYARNRLHFHELVTFNNKKLKTTLGGAGLAISKNCRHPNQAVQYLEFVAHANCQSYLYFESGGQPGHRKAWTSELTNTMSNDFFKATLPALDRAYLRPRYEGFIYFQDNAGLHIQDYMIKGGKEEVVLDELNKLYLKSLT